MKIFWSEEGLNEDNGVHVEPASLPPIDVSKELLRLNIITDQNPSEEPTSGQERFSHQHFSILIDYAFMLIMPFPVLRTR